MPLKPCRNDSNTVDEWRITMSNLNKLAEIHTDNRRPSLKGPLIGLGLIVLAGLVIVATNVSRTSPPGGQVFSCI